MNKEEHSKCFGSKCFGSMAGCLSVLLLSVTISAGRAVAESPPLLKPAESAGMTSPNLSSGFTDGVRAYRDGDYAGAARILGELHRKSPQDTRTTYYLAMTQAQKGNFKEAARLYEEILKREPEGRAARLAREGLRYLPSEGGEWDAPPRFGDGGMKTVDTDARTAQSTGLSDSSRSPGTGMPPLSPASAQDWMAWQMMMGQTGRNGNDGWNNMIPPWMTQQSGNSANGSETPDPNMMRDMLMERMMQDFTLSGERDENR